MSAPSVSALPVDGTQTTFIAPCNLLSVCLVQPRKSIKGTFQPQFHLFILRYLRSLPRDSRAHSGHPRDFMSTQRKPTVHALGPWALSVQMGAFRKLEAHHARTLFCILW